jgi:hypothetical protein
MKTIYNITLFFYFSSTLFAQSNSIGNAQLTFSKNYRIYPSNVTQSEVFIVKSPIDQNILFVGCNTMSFSPFFISEGIYVTTDGGEQWRGSDTCSGAPIGYHGGDPGIAIDRNGTFIITRLGRPPFVGLYSHYSPDNGVTWSSQKVISTDDLERAALATDVIPASSYAGRTYAAWTKLSQPFPLMFSFSDDGGKNWSSQRQVNNPVNRCAGGDIAVGPDGRVYTCWAGVAESSPFKEIFVGFASSANGGGIWTVTENAVAMNGITGILPEKNNIRVNGLPVLAVDTTNGSRRGWIYMVTGQKALSPAGSDPDIILYRSADAGTTWSAGIRVNQDALNNGKDQYFPNIHIDKYGAVDVIFYDDRNTTADSAGVFLARSVDGGDTWKEFEISDHHFKPVPIGGLGQGYQGDVIDLTSAGLYIWPVWMDNSSGLYQVWTSPVDFTSVNGVEEDVHSPVSSALKQNYPNPFTTGTKIVYRVSKAGKVSLKVFDVLGHEVCELVNERKYTGSYEIEFIPSDYLNNKSSGSNIFFYRLVLNDRVETRRMICIK